MTRASAPTWWAWPMLTSGSCISRPGAWRTRSTPSTASRGPSARVTSHLPSWFTGSTNAPAPTTSRQPITSRAATRPDGPAPSSATSPAELRTAAMPNAATGVSARATATCRRSTARSGGSGARGLAIGPGIAVGALEHDPGAALASGEHVEHERHEPDGGDDDARHQQATEAGEARRGDHDDAEGEHRQPAPDQVRRVAGRSRRGRAQRPETGRQQHEREHGGHRQRERPLPERQTPDGIGGLVGNGDGEREQRHDQQLQPQRRERTQHGPPGARQLTQPEHQHDADHHHGEGGPLDPAERRAPR